jgi:uroporphyrin-III C-methyltransferase/precorrin-2 dehydrogenase/sirohydrochlorin ferrochelatase
MLHSLPLFHRIAGQPVIVLGDGEAAEAKRRLVERAGGIVVDSEESSARLAFVALEEPEEALARLRARGVLVNTVDRPELCDFTVPSILERDPVLVAVGTGGASAGLAKALRLRLETLLPPGLGKLAAALGAARAALRTRFPDPGERRRALDGALSQGGPLDPLADDAAGQVTAWLDSVQGAGGGCAEIRLTSGDPDDLTLRQARLLGSADLIAYEPGVAPAILDRARADAARQELDKGASLACSRGLTVILRRD